MVESDTIPSEEFPTIWDDVSSYRFNPIETTITDLYPLLAKVIETKGCPLKKLVLLDGETFNGREITNLIVPVLLQSAEFKLDAGITIAVAHVLDTIKNKNDDYQEDSISSTRMSIPVPKKVLREFNTITLFREATKYLKTVEEMHIVLVALRHI